MSSPYICDSFPNNLFIISLIQGFCFTVVFSPQDELKQLFFGSVSIPSSSGTLNSELDTD